MIINISNNSNQKTTQKKTGTTYKITKQYINSQNNKNKQNNTNKTHNNIPPAPCHLLQHATSVSHLTTASTGSDIRRAPNWYHAQIGAWKCSVATPCKYLIVRLLPTSCLNCLLDVVLQVASAWIRLVCGSASWRCPCK